VNGKSSKGKVEVDKSGGLVGACQESTEKKKSERKEESFSHAINSVAVVEISGSRRGKSEWNYFSFNCTGKLAILFVVWRMKEKCAEKFLIKIY